MNEDKQWNDFKEWVNTEFDKRNKEMKNDSKQIIATIVIVNLFIFVSVILGAIYFK